MHEKEKDEPPSVRVLLGDGRVGNDHIFGRIEPLVTRVERCPLARLGNTALSTLCCGFEYIDFWGGPAHKRAVTVLRPRVILTGTGATREPLARKV